MKKLIIVMIALILITGCANDKTIKGMELESYGVINRSDKFCENVNYDISMGSVIWMGFFPVGTIIAGGFDLWEPVSVIDDSLPIVCIDK